MKMEMTFSIKQAVGRCSLHVLFAGHVDAGKSTLMGHLLYRLGDVSKKSMHKYPFLTTKFQLKREKNTKRETKITKLLHWYPA